MSNIPLDYAEEERQAKLRREQPLLWTDVVLWIVSASLIAAVWIVIAKVVGR